MLSYHYSQGDNMVINESDLRSSTGGIGLLTRDVVTRVDLTMEAFLMALTPFINNVWNDNINTKELDI